MRDRKLRIWLLAEGEGLPITEDTRLMRMGMLAKYLSGQGHKVTWWSSTFLHGEKKYCFREHKEILVNENERLILLHVPVSYKKNMSLRRIVYHQLLSKQFAVHSRKKHTPDIILCAWPIPQFAREAISFGKREEIPVILDARDMWPDIYVRAFPRKLARLAEGMLIPMKISTSRIFGSVDGLTGITPAMVQWACRYAKREQGPGDQVIPIANEPVEIQDKEYERILGWWRERGVCREDWILCYVGTFGSHVDLETVIEAIKKLAEEKRNIKLVIAGDGDRKKEFMSLADGCSSIIFAGWVNGVQMSVLMRIAKAGVLCLKDTFDFRDTLNNKAVQYLSEGLPIVNSLSGYARGLILERHMGISYTAEDEESCRRSIESLYMDENARRVMSVNARKCFNEMFDFHVVNKMFEDYLLKMAKVKGR